MRITVVISGRNVKMHTRLPTDSLMAHNIWGAFTLRPRIKGIKAISKDSWTVNGPKSSLQHLCNFYPHSLTIF